MQLAPPLCAHQLDPQQLQQPYHLEEQKQVGLLQKSFNKLTIRYRDKLLYHTVREETKRQKFIHELIHLK